MLTLKAPAKINWFLNVLGLRDDGFHEIQSLIQKITLYDVLTFIPSKEIILQADERIPTEQNLIYKAAIFLKSKYDVKRGALIHLDKNIPIGAGLGGGSSDAAAALIGLNKLWSLDLSTRDLCKVAEQLGSDVSFFLCSSLSLVCGRGEKVNPRRARKTLNILLVKPSFDILTAWAYNELSVKSNALRDKNITQNFELNSSPITRHSSLSLKLTKKARKVNNIEHFIRKIERAEVSDLAGVVSNDLELVIIKNFPVIAEIKERLMKEGAAFSLMSGSGSTVFGVFDTLKNAEEASRNFNNFWTTVVQTIID